MAGDDGASTPGGGWVPVPDPTRLTGEAVMLAKDDLRRELATLRELLGERIARLEAIIHDVDSRFSAEIGRRIDSIYAMLNQRDDGIEAELQIFIGALRDAPDLHDQLRERLQTDIQIAVRRLEELHAEKFTSMVTKFGERDVWLHEKFDGLARQFAERDVRAEQGATASKQALDAALLAAKELVGQQNIANGEAAAKAEASTTKQIDQIGVIITTMEKSFTDRLTELKERIDRGEGGAGGMASAQLQQVREHEHDSRITANRLLAMGIVLSLVVVIVNVVFFALSHH
jgi:hypothetical protein